MTNPHVFEGFMGRSRGMHPNDSRFEHVFLSCDSPVGGLCPSTGFVPQAWIHHKAARSLLPMRLTVSTCFNHFDKLDQLANPPIWEMIHNAND